MLDQVLSAVKSAASDKLVSEIGLPADKLDDTMDIGKESMVAGLGGAISDGNISGILELFKGQTAPQQSPIVSAIQGQFTSLMVSKLGIDQGMASTVGSFLIPFIMEKIVGKAKEEGIDNEQGIAGMLGGDLGKDLLGNLLKGSGGGGGIGGMLGGFFK